MTPASPRWIYPLALAGFGLVLLPLLSLAGSVDWQRFPSLVTSESAQQALWLSLRTATTSTVLCLLLGIPMALVLARHSWPLLRGAVLLPLVLPPVVGGIALLHTFGRLGLIGQHLAAAGISIAFSTTAVVLAQTFVALPFLVLTLEAAIRSAGTKYETMAATLGAGPSRALWTVTTPLLLPALAAGTVLAFARALGEFGATLTFAGSLAGRTRTLPLEIYLQRESNPEAALALSMVLLLVALLVAIGTHRAYRSTAP